MACVSDGDSSTGMLLEHGPAPLRVLSLRADELLSSSRRYAIYQVLVLVFRILPAITLYGGTIGIIMCFWWTYRWGVLMAMMLYSFFMVIGSLEVAVFGPIGMLRCWVDNNKDWFAMHSRAVQRERSPGRSSFRSDDSDDTPSQVLEWNDIFHVVMIPNYMTPIEVLEISMKALAQYSLASTNLGVCLAFEERETGAPEKAQTLKGKFPDKFHFITSTYHPPGLPNHVPGKSSNECWAFFELERELREVHGFSRSDPRVVITVIDDDSELHENYFEALTYHFLRENLSTRYITIFQPPIVHFKNFLTQPLLVRTASIFTSLHELACLANPFDTHVLFSSYSLSLVLATAVGGWDPDFISEDWHMTAKCKLHTEGLARCKPIFLPLMNYAPEEDTWCGTMRARWVQAKRHALGVGEIVFVGSKILLGAFELQSGKRRALFVWRMLPLLGKFSQVHFGVGTLGVWPILSHILINFYMWRSWCAVNELNETCHTCCTVVAAASIANGHREQVVLNSWMVYFQQQATAGLALCLVSVGGFGALYFHLVKHRVGGDVDGTWWAKGRFILWACMELEVIVFGQLGAFMFASAPEWVAAVRIVTTLQFTHAVASMAGREAPASGEE